MIDNITLKNDTLEKLINIYKLFLAFGALSCLHGVFRGAFCQARRDYATRDLELYCQITLSTRGELGKGPKT